MRKTQSGGKAMNRLELIAFLASLKTLHECENYKGAEKVIDLVLKEAMRHYPDDEDSKVGQ